MKRSIGKMAVWGLVSLFVASMIAVPAAIACSAAANCGGGQLVWCQTFGNCGSHGATCWASDGQEAYCGCNGVETHQVCPAQV